MNKKEARKNKYVKFRHKFFFATLRPIVRLIARKFRFKTKAVKTEKGKNYLILSNHQSYFDPAFIALTIKKPIYFIASDALYSQKWYLRLLFYCFGPIKKRKGIADAACVRAVCRIAKEGGNICIFPEGERQWNDSVFHIEKSVVKLVRMLKLPLILYNFHGGYGVQPRWGKSLRKGKYTGEIREIIPYEEISKMSDDELYEKIVFSLKIIDSDSGELYKSESRAEYLERQLFVCPKCGALHMLHSHGNEITCDNCGLTVTYGENLRLTSPDPEFYFDKLIDWYEFQQRFVRDYEIGDGVLLMDENVGLYDKTERERVLVATGKLTLTKDALKVGDYVLPTSEIYGGTAHDGDKISFGAGKRAYLIKGNERFNGIKYVLFFNRVCKQIESKGGDTHYGLYPHPELR